MDTIAETVPLLDRLDAVSMALSRIHLLSSIHYRYDLKPQETALICEIIFEIAEQAYPMM